MERGMVDEIIVHIVPVTLGSGQRLFNLNNKESAWTLENCTPFDNGVVRLRYRAQTE